MNIFVESRKYIEKMYDKNPDWIQGKYIISIFSNGDVSPLPGRFNILQLEFDDIADQPDHERAAEKFNLIYFNKYHAKMIHEFIEKIPVDSKKPFYVHCDAGVSRSGAVGMVLNEYFNKFLTANRLDYEAFQMNNSHILPNPLVTRILKNELFGPMFIGIEVNDYEYNEDGEKLTILKGFKK